MFVIFGASGKVGQTSAAALRRADQPVRAVVRNAAQGEPLARLGCEVVLGDLMDGDSVVRALDGAHSAQMLCPVARGDAEPADAMRRVVDTAAKALSAYPALHVVALSDYGAELDADTGITMVFHHLEAQFKQAVRHLTLLRSAEHVQNWARVMPVALATGVLPSFHQPVDRKFPMVSAHDVGVVAAQLLLERNTGHTARVVSIEGSHRYSPNDVAHALSEASHRDVVARALPRDQWTPTLLRAGLNANHAQLITDLYDATNAGRIDVENGVGERRFGATTPREVLAALMPALATR
ncbi:NmrA family transcriptional regulator [Trinickia violacea]|uniref:NmrA family transcriptional regulator n=1 Tax=Trinickia violacea TaxID=2571746 RepID=A0A4V1EI55_9BURK|nr:NmrA family NAD(P)-binding protein [Trinickia violacea]QCP52590.1 NmrA family transcriptional regulator [Trinickia violacea]